MRIASLATTQGRFSLLALDEVVARFPVETAEVRTWLTSAVTNLSPYVSGLVLDAGLGIGVIPSKAKKVGVALRLEALNASQDPLSLPLLQSDWGVEEISQNYAVAKVQLYYHPQEEKALDKKKWLAEVADFCHHQQIDLLVSLSLFQPPNMAEAVTTDSLIEALQELRASADLFALEAPADPLALATITAELDQPWVVRLGEQSYQQTKDTLRTCLENGARGWIAGAGLWSDLPSFVGKDNQLDWKVAEAQLVQDVRDRVMELARITNEFTPLAGTSTERSTHDEVT